MGGVLPCSSSRLIELLFTVGYDFISILLKINLVNNSEIFKWLIGRMFKLR